MKFHFKICKNTPGYISKLSGGRLTGYSYSFRSMHLYSNEKKCRETIRILRFQVLGKDIIKVMGKGEENN